MNDSGGQEHATVTAVIVAVVVTTGRRPQGLGTVFNRRESARSELIRVADEFEAAVALDDGSEESLDRGIAGR